MEFTRRIDSSKLDTDVRQIFAAFSSLKSNVVRLLYSDIDAAVVEMKKLIPMDNNCRCNMGRRGTYQSFHTLTACSSCINMRKLFDLRRIEKYLLSNCRAFLPKESVTELGGMYIIETVAANSSVRINKEASERLKKIFSN